MTPREYKSALDQLAISHADFAAAIGVSASTSYRWATGARSIPWSVVLVLRYWHETGIAPGQIGKKSGQP